MLKAALAMTTYAIVHSALASRPAKRAAGRLVGERARDGLYRPFYLAQSIVTTAALAAYIRRLPDREIYRARGPLAWMMRAGQAAGLAYLGWGSLTVGLRNLTGFDGVKALATGGAVVPPPMEAHGPVRDGGGMRVSGPFRYGRHPMNLAFVPILWLHPRMSDNLLVMNLVATAYLVLGSKHEEARLVAAYGRDYDAYRAGGVPFFLPGSPIARPAGRPRGPEPIATT